MRVDFDLRVFQAEAAAVRAPADGNEHAVELLGAEFAGPFKGDLDLIAAQAERAHLGIQIDALAKERCQAVCAAA